MIRVNNFWQGLSLFLLNLDPKTQSTKLVSRSPISRSRR